MQYHAYVNGVLVNDTYNYQFHPEGGPSSLYIGAFYTSLFFKGKKKHIKRNVLTLALGVILTITTHVSQ